MTAPSQRVWLATCVSLIFLIGASVGVLVDHFLLKPPPPAVGPVRPDAGPAFSGGPPIDRVLQDLDHALTLTATQRQRIVEILNARLPHLREMQAEARDRFNMEQKSLHADISAVLTPEQIKRFDEMAPIPAGPGRGGPGERGGPGPGRGRRGGN
jgi:Spy/CpxP family protein refolding chaperone